MNIGIGYIDLVSVTCADVNETKIASSLERSIPFYELGLNEMVLCDHKEGHLAFKTNLSSCINDIDIIFNAVESPLGKEQYVLNVANPELSKEGAPIQYFMSPDRVVVDVESEKYKEMMDMIVSILN